MIPARIFGGHARHDGPTKGLNSLKHRHAQHDLHPLKPLPSSQQLLHHLPMHVRQPEVSALEAVGEF